MRTRASGVSGLSQTVRETARPAQSGSACGALRRHTAGGARGPCLLLFNRPSAGNVLQRAGACLDQAIAVIVRRAHTELHLDRVSGDVNQVGVVVVHVYLQTSVVNQFVLADAVQPADLMVTPV